MTLLIVFGIGAGLAQTRQPRAQLAYRATGGAVALASVLLVLWGVWLFATAGWRGDSWFETGQEVDTSLAGTYRILGGIATIAGVLITVAASRLRRRRLPTARVR
ncbi:MAG: hypothetical protein R2705_01045 [Ilumatobacteraceae bacterium]